MEKEREKRSVRVNYKKIVMWTLLILILVIGSIFLTQKEGVLKEKVVEESKENVENVKGITETEGTNEKGNEIKCQGDGDCIPAECCHADSCVAKVNGPICEGMFCTLSCETVLDCEGRCGCVQGQCAVVPER